MSPADHRAYRSSASSRLPFSPYNRRAWRAGQTPFIVVDNASSDGTADMVRAKFPEGWLFVNECNTENRAGTGRSRRAPVSGSS